MSLKSKLQELCQKRSWGYPDYKTERLGQSHNPLFKTTVTVNGISFESPLPSKNLKNSHADAAQLALHYFQSPPPPLPDQINHLPNTNATQPQHLFKSQLQAYAQKRGLPLPEYACTPDGPPHACRFTCKVTVAQLTYHCPQLFNTVKESENAAAKLALLSLLPSTTQQDDLPVYKNLLQELAQKQGVSLPTYTTQTNGMSHIPTFVASVDIKGEIFQGEIAKTKKQAEMNAAKVAYTIIKERGTSLNREFTPATSQPHEAKSSDLKSQFIVDSQENVRLKSPLISNMGVLPLEGSEQGRAGGEEEPKTITSINVPAAAADMLKLGQPSINNNHSSESTRKRGPPEIPAHAVTVEQPSGSGNDGRCKKVCIFPRMLNMELPPGKTVFCDDRWIAIETSQAEAT